MKRRVSPTRTQSVEVKKHLIRCKSSRGPRARLVKTKQRKRIRHIRISGRGCPRYRAFFARGGERCTKEHNQASSCRVGFGKTWTLAGRGKEKGRDTKSIRCPLGVSSYMEIAPRKGIPVAMRVL